MSVRTRPSDRKRVLLTEQDAAKIDELWMIENGTYEAHLAQEQEFQQQKAILAAKWGRAPSDTDVRWALYNKQLAQHAKNGDWGLYRNTRLEMANLLKREKRYRQALDTYLEISYFDANGPSNMGGPHDPEFLRRFPPFDQAMAFQAPAILRSVLELSDSLDISENDLKQAFMVIANRLHESMRLPVSPESGWDVLRSRIDFQ
jgi:hypothetical protein